MLGTLLSILLVRDTRDHVRLEWRARAESVRRDRFREVFALTSFRDRNLFAASQAGLVNNLNDGMSWGIFPLFFAAFGLGVERIGILKAVYPATWGLLQIATGPLSDRWGRKGLIVAGMWVQAAALFLTAATRDFGWWLVGSLLARPRHGDGLSEPDRRRLRCFASDMARALAQRLPVLARPRLCDRRAHRRGSSPIASGFPAAIGSIAAAHLPIRRDRRRADAGRVDVSASITPPTDADA